MDEKGKVCSEATSPSKAMSTNTPNLPSKSIIMILLKLVRYWILFCILLLLSPVVFPWYISSQWRSIIHAFIPLMYKFSARYSQPLTDESRIRRRKPFIDAVLALYRCEYPDTALWEGRLAPMPQQDLASGASAGTANGTKNVIQSFGSFLGPQTTVEQQQLQGAEAHIQTQAEGAYLPESDLTQSARQPMSTSTTPHQASIPARQPHDDYYDKYYRKYRWDIRAVFAEDAEFQDPLIDAQGIDEIYASFQPLILWCKAEHTIRAVSHYEQATMIQLNQKWTFPILGSIPYMRSTVWIEFSGEELHSQAPVEMSATMKISKMYDLWNDTTLLANAKWARRLSCVIMTYPILIFADADLFWLVSRVYQHFVANLIRSEGVRS